MSKDQRDFVRVNERIRFSPVRVVAADGSSLGVMPTRQALTIAQDQGLDLIEIAPQARPPVCRILDYGKFKYEQGLKEKEQKQKRRHNELKEVRFRPSIGSHDADVKTKQIQKFLESGQRVQLKIVFQRRENAHKDLGFRLAQDIILKLEGVGKPQNSPRLDGRDITCILEPIGN